MKQNHVPITWRLKMNNPVSRSEVIFWIIVCVFLYDARLTSKEVAKEIKRSNDIVEAMQKAENPDVASKTFKILKVESEKK
jgi:hypothetical protein